MADEAERGQETSSGRARKKPRRASAPATGPASSGSVTPEADWAAWLSKKDDGEATKPRRVMKDARDRWFEQERPPHW